MTLQEFKAAMLAIYESGITGSAEIAVMQALLWHCDDGMVAYPGIQRLTEMTRTSERTVQGALRRLLAAGHLEVVAGGRGGRSKSTRYRLKNPAAFAGYEVGENPAGPAPLRTNPAAAAPFAAETPQNLHENPAAAAPERVVERVSSSSPPACADASEPVEGEVVPPPTLYEQVLHTCGVSDGRRLPPYWCPPAAEIHVNGWRREGDGLTDEEIIAVAQAERARHSDPPNGPKALDRAMRLYAEEKRRAAVPIPLHPSREGDARHAPASRFPSAAERSAARTSEGIDRRLAIAASVGGHRRDG